MLCWLINYYCRPIASLALSTTRTLRILNLLEEIVAFIIYQHKCREVFDFDFPDSFHPQFWVGHAFQTLNTGLCQYRRRAADAAEVESTVLMACVGDLLAAVAFGQHHHACAVRLEQINV